jgi:DNA-directed RNA polymerase I subunit RPA12
MVIMENYMEYFCDFCGTIKPIPILNTELPICPLCSQTVRINKLLTSERVVKLHFEKRIQIGDHAVGERPMIEERCPNCGQEGLYFTTAQLRSADEGQTVFYECPKCGHRFSQNS